MIKSNRQTGKHVMKIPVNKEKGLVRDENEPEE